VDTDEIPVQAARVGTAADNSAAMLHVSTADGVPLALELPGAAVPDLIEQLQRVATNLTLPAVSRRLH
jgi:hypothetical protein